AARRVPGGGGPARVRAETAEPAPRRPRRGREQRELRPIEADQLSLGRAEAAHPRAAVEVALDEPPSAERDRDAGEHRGEERRQREKAPRALHRGAHLRPTGLEIVDALAALQAGL